MIDDFAVIPDRRASDSIKWHVYASDVIPMWVADMDFLSPQPVIQALQRRVSHGIFGYSEEPVEFRELLVQRLDEKYRWKIEPDDIVFLPGVVLGFNLACHAFTEPGDAYLIQTPVYGPFFNVAQNTGLECKEVELIRSKENRYSIDFDAFKNALDHQTRLFLMCNPHNPVGRVFTREELIRMAQICLENDVVICSDEIHCDLVYSGAQHIPIASLTSEIANKTVTLMAPSKTYNIAGLDCSFAIIQNPELRTQFLQARKGLVGGVNLLGMTAALAAFRDGQPWLDAVLTFLEKNRDFLYEFVHDRLPGMKMPLPEATYLAWLDCSGIGIEEEPSKFFLENARVAMNNGGWFGKPGKGFVRLNFGCPRPQLENALLRMEKSLQSLRSTL